MRVWMICMAVIFAAPVLGGGACDDGGGGGVTNISSSKKLKDLSDSEAEELCIDFSTYVRDAMGVDFGCLTTGLIAGLGDADKCQEAYDACVAQADAAVEEDCKPDPEEEDDMEDCEATVGELEECAEDSADLFQKAMSDYDIEFSCDMDLKDVQDMENFEEPEQPASCKTLEEKCPSMSD